MIPPILKELTVQTTPIRAFDIFWSQIGDWWPLDTHSLSGMAGQEAIGIEFEPEVGGAITEIMEDGSRMHWGTVTEWVPGQAMAFTWQLGRPEEEATHVRVAFVGTEEGTRVSLAHTGWEHRGEDAESGRESYDSGWNAVFFESYAAACASAVAG